VKKAPLILLFLLFIYLLGHGVAAASDLVLYYDSKEIKMFFDKENIATTGDIKQVWIEVKYEPPVKIGNAYTSSVLGLLEINCKNKQHRDLKFTAYYTTGGDQTVPGNETWRSIVPDTPTERKRYIEKYVFSKSKKRNQRNETR
jgi:hypothetical protein